MRKIGIITFHNTYNYGACLQAYALQNYLSSRGHDVEIIDYDSNITKHYNLILPKFRKNLLLLMQQLCGNVKHYKSRKYNADNFKAFTKKYLKLSNKHYKNIRRLKKDTLNYDTLICGSDQVWNGDLVGKCDEGYLLNFGPDFVMRISYAASIGLDAIPQKYIPKFKKYLTRFDAISVREHDAVLQIKELSSKEVSVVLDPVFLISKEEWIQNFDLVDNSHSPYIFVYSVTINPFLDECVKQLVNQTGLKVVCFNSENQYPEILKSIRSCRPDEFVNYIYHAEYVISNSFHAAALSIIFEKKFFVIPHATLNSRIKNLLTIVGLEERQISKHEGIYQDICEKEINYEEVRSRIQMKIKYSKEFLEKYMN